VESKEKLAKATNLGEADAKHVCPKCGGSMIIKLGRGGKFLSCARYPDCDGGLMIDGQEIKGDTPIGNDPTTGLPIFVKVGRFGPYVQLGNAETLAKLITDGSPIPETVPTKAEKLATEKAKEAEDAGVPKKKPRKSKKKAGIKPRMASIPKGKDLGSVTVEDAMVYLSLPRKLGDHPETGKTITASIGRFGPYIVHDGDFRSLKGDDSPYTITLDRALEKLKEVKKVGRGRWAKKKETKE
jgi:DNA topoisomerase-1